MLNLVVFQYWAIWKSGSRHNSGRRWIRMQEAHVFGQTSLHIANKCQLMQWMRPTIDNKVIYKYNKCSHTSMYSIQKMLYKFSANTTLWRGRFCICKYYWQPSNSKYKKIQIQLHPRTASKQSPVAIIGTRTTVKRCLLLLHSLLTNKQ